MKFVGGIQMAEIINETQFDEEVLKSDLPVLVDFFAAWCMPCKMIAPSLEELADEVEDRAKIIKVDIDQMQDLAVKYTVKSIPTLLLFKDGEVVDTIIGAAPKEDIKEKLFALL